MRKRLKFVRMDYYYILPTIVIDPWWKEIELLWLNLELIIYFGKNRRDNNE